jgi:hypothetical protein
VFECCRSDGCSWRTPAVDMKKEVFIELAVLVFLSQECTDPVTFLSEAIRA